MSDVGSKAHPTDSERSIYHHMVRGAAWALLMRWGVRGIGLLSVIILARLLTPDDFGIFAIAALSIGFLESFSELGVDSLLIRERDCSREDYDTGWTIKLLQCLALAAVLLTMAPLLASYFDEPRAEPVIQWLALSAVLGGLQNIGIVLFRKELDFAKDFRFTIYRRLLSFVVTISLAIALRTYWALVVGHIASIFFAVWLSFRMHPYRPRWCLAKWRKFLSYAMSMNPANIARFFNERVDALLVGRLADTVTLGTYNVAADISKMATSEAVVPIGRALFPSYAKISHDAQQLSTAYLHSLSVIAIMCVSLGVGLSLVAEDFVLVVLGDQWTSAIPLLQWLALYAAAVAFVQTVGGHILIVTGQERLFLALTWARLAVFTAAVFAAGLMWGIALIPIAATAVAVVFIPVVGYIVTRSIPVTARQLIGTAWRPAGAGTVMAVVVHIAHLDGIQPLISLASDIAVGAVAFGFALIALWWLAGRPAGVERAALDYTGKLIRRSVGSKVKEAKRVQPETNLDS